MVKSYVVRQWWANGRKIGDIKTTDFKYAKNLAMNQLMRGRRVQLVRNFG